MKISIILLFLTISSVFSQDFVYNTGPFNYTNDFTKFAESQIGHKLNFTCLSGHVPIDWYYSDNNSSLHYTFYTKQGHKSMEDISNAEIPLIIWFQGGPGGSSEFGSFTEFGPFEVDKDQKLLQRFHSWNKQAHLMFISQPLGCGFSYTDSTQAVNSTETAAKHVENFFYNFFVNTFPEMKNITKYIFGESYGGHYIPRITNILLHNTTDYNVKGIGIGDGLYNGEIQTTLYSKYLYAVGILSINSQKEMMIAEEQILQDYQQKDYVKATDDIGNLISDDLVNKLGGINILNYEQYGEEEDFYPTFLKNFTANITSPDTAKYVKYTDSNGTVGGAFAENGDIALQFSKDVKDLIEYKNGAIRVLIYNGQLDIEVNTLGMEAFVNNLNLTNQVDFLLARRDKWMKVNLISQQKKLYGNHKCSKNLCFAVVYGAGHLVPRDQPESSYVMVEDFLEGKWFDSDRKNDENIKN